MIVTQTIGDSPTIAVVGRSGVNIDGAQYALPDEPDPAPNGLKYKAYEA